MHREKDLANISLIFFGYMLGGDLPESGERPRKGFYRPVCEEDRIGLKHGRRSALVIQTLHDHS
jgi:hypothetical protein